MKFFISLWLLFAVSPSWALTCKNDYAGASGCAANSTAVGDCETLGFALTEVEGCLHYLYCPFNPLYKRCVTQATEETVNCDSYPSMPCPTGATACTSCTNGTTTSYRIVSCKTGYKLTRDGRCEPNVCNGYGYIDGPLNATSSSCESGEKTLKRIIYCDASYQLRSIYSYPKNVISCFENSCKAFPIPLSTSAPNAQSTTKCFSGVTWKYRVSKCKAGYVIKDDNCVMGTTQDCNEFPNTSVPANATYATCSGNNTKRYRIIECQTGFSLNSAGTKCESINCNGYPSTTKPANAESYSCTSDGKTTYRIASCSRGYELSQDESICEPADCSGYPHKSCPAGANCVPCESADQTFYYVSSCRTGYQLSNETCITFN